MLLLQKDLFILRTFQAEDMKLEDQVCSLDLAKRLAKLGVDTESYFSWMEHGEGPETLHVRKNEVTPYTYEYPAFTVAELGEMLPTRVKGTILVTGHLHDGWTLQYRLHDSIVHEIRDLKEADARAKMLIYLIENGQVKTEAKP